MFAMLLREQELLTATDTSSVRSIRLGSAPISEALPPPSAAPSPPRG